MRKSLNNLLIRLSGFRENGKEVPLLPMIGAFASDVITEYAYGFKLRLDGCAALQ